MKKILLIIILILCIFQMVVLATAIDIGITPSDEANYAETYTHINVGNPANVSGVITSIQIYAVTGNDLVNCEVATFNNVAGLDFSTRDTETIGAVTGGSVQTFSNLSLDVVAGDYIGIYFTGGRLEYSIVAGDGVWRDLGDQIPCVESTFELKAGRFVSIYGFGISYTWNIKVLQKWNGVVPNKWNGI